MKEFQQHFTFVSIVSLTVCVSVCRVYLTFWHAFVFFGCPACSFSLQKFEAEHFG